MCMHTHMSQQGVLPAAAGRRRDLTQPPVCAPAEVCTPMAHPTCPRAAPQAPALATARAPTLTAPSPDGTADTRSTAPDAGASPSASAPGDGRVDAERATTREPTSSGACGTRRRVSACRLASSRPARQRALHVRARPPTSLTPIPRTPSACAQPPRARLRARALGGIAARGIHVIGGGLGDLAPRTLAQPARKATTLCTLPRRTSPAPALAQFDSTELSVFASSTQARRKCFSSGGRQAWRHARGIAGCAPTPWPPRTPRRPSTL